MTLARGGLLGILVVYAVLAWNYATATPIWQNPDEPAHFNYVAYIARTGTLPVLQAGDWDADLLERLKNGALRPDDSPERIRYEGWQPPLAYLAAVPVYLASAPDVRDRVIALRLFDAALGGATLLLAYGAARAMFSSASLSDRLLALAVPLLMVGVPMYVNVSASVTNDALTNLVAAALTWILLRVLVGSPAPHSRRAWLLLGALLGIGWLVKPWLFVFAPLVPIAFGLGAWRNRLPVRLAVSSTVTALGLACLLYLPWLMHQGLTYGWNDLLASKRHDSVVVGQPRFPGFTETHIQYWITTTFHSFWAQFGWMAIPAPDRLYWYWGAATVLAVLGLVVAAVRALPRLRQPRQLDPRPLLLLVAFAGTLAAVVLYNLTFIQAQGRYLYPAMVPIAILAVYGWSALVPRRLGGPLALLLAAGLVALNWYTFVNVLVPGFRG